MAHGLKNEVDLNNEDQPKNKMTQKMKKITNMKTI